MAFWKKRSKPDDPRDTYNAMRARALSAVQDGHIEIPAETPDVGGVVVDFPVDGEWASLIALAGGTTSLYTTGTFGVIGGEFYESVVAANAEVLGQAQLVVSLFEESESDASPPDGWTRLFVLSDRGRLRLDVPDSEFWGDPGPEHRGLIDATHSLMNSLFVATRRVSD